MQRLIYDKTRSLVQIGDKVMLPNHMEATEATVEGIIPPHKPSSTGRVGVRYWAGYREYFPSVIGASWREYDPYFDSSILSPNDPGVPQDDG